MAYPELIYLYIEDFGYCFHKQEFVFSSNFDVRYAKEGNRALIVSPKENPFRGIYGADITNISLLVGNNGSGKTSVMELLTQPEIFAKNIQKKFPEKAASMGWFAVYAVDVPDREETREATYYLEGWNDGLISNFTEKPSGTAQSYSCYFAMQGEKLVRFSRGNISDKLQLYYYPVSNRPFSISQKAEDTEVTKRIIKPADAWNFFRFICLSKNLINESVRAENVEFSIKVEYAVHSIEGYDIGVFQGNKARFLLNLHRIFGMDLERYLEPEFRLEQEMALNRDFDMKGLPEEVWRLYYGMLHEAGYDNVQALYRYDKRMNHILEYTVPSWFRQEQSDKRKKLINDIRKQTRILAVFSQIDERYFISELQVDIPAAESSFFENMKWIFDWFEEYRKEGAYLEDSLNLPFVRCEYRNISEGEEAFLRFFSGVMEGVKGIPQNDTNVYQTRILLLDEPDLSMHPEWSRRFLKDLTKLLSNVLGKERVSYQIILSTHSPFMTSDVLKENVLCFQRVQDSGTIQVHPSKYGLLSNIHDIMADTFFLSSPFGALGNEIFEKIVCKINKLKSADDPQISMILAYVSAIGDSFIWSQVNLMLQNKLQELAAAGENSKQKRIQILEEEIKLLKGENLK